MLKFALVAVVAGLALAGCTESEPGEAVPTGQNTQPGGAPSGSGQPNVTIPPRPRDISLDGLDPCKLFNKSQLDQIKVNRTKATVQTEATFKGAQRCDMNGEDGQVYFTYEAWLITTEGIEHWLTGKRNVDAKLISVEGFPGASFKLRATSSFACDAAVGVANNQQLMVQFRPTNRDAFSQEQMCQKSEQAATLAMQTLKTLK